MNGLTQRQRKSKKTNKFSRYVSKERGSSKRGCRCVRGGLCAVMVATAYVLAAFALHTQIPENGPLTNTLMMTDVQDVFDMSSLQDQKGRLVALGFSTEEIDGITHAWRQDDYKKIYTSCFSDAYEKVLDFKKECESIYDAFCKKYEDVNTFRRVCRGFNQFFGRIERVVDAKKKRERMKRQKKRLIKYEHP